MTIDVKVDFVGRRGNIVPSGKFVRPKPRLDLISMNFAEIPEKVWPRETTHANLRFILAPSPI
jgi:hypothetical protein